MVRGLAPPLITAAKRFSVTRQTKPPNQTGSTTHTYTVYPVQLTVAPAKSSTCTHTCIPAPTSTNTTTASPAMAVDEGTQTNGAAEPRAGQLDASNVQQSRWTVQTGMS
jgi:hypothetical protein